MIYGYLRVITDEQIRVMLTEIVSKTRIAEKLGVNRSTLRRFLRNWE